MTTNQTIAKGDIVQFKTSDGLVLEGFLVRREKTKPCVIYVHEWGGNFYREPAAGMVRELSRRKISALSINTRGHDKVAFITRIVGKKRTRLVGGVELEKFEETVLDIDGAIKYLKQLGFRKFVLCGHSTGCQKVTYYQFRKINSDVIGLVLMSPSDDYNIWKHMLGRNFDKTVKMAKKLVEEGDGYQFNFVHGETPQRFLSVADTENIEARLFNYNGKLKEFSKIRTPVLVLFGSKEKPSREPYLKLLESRSNSNFFESHVIKGVGHYYLGSEGRVADIISNFVSQVESRPVNTRD